MRTGLAIIAAIFALSGCKTLDLSAITGGGTGTTLTRIGSDPIGALVTVEGFGECVTPCTVEIDKPRNITIAKAGFDPQRLVLQPGKRKLNVTLQLSAPTTDVYSAELPEI